MYLLSTSIFWERYVNGSCGKVWAARVHHWLHRACCGFAVNLGAKLQSQSVKGEQLDKQLDKLLDKQLDEPLDNIWQRFKEWLKELACWACCVFSEEQPNYIKLPNLQISRWPNDSYLNAACGPTIQKCRWRPCSNMATRLFYVYSIYSICQTLLDHASAIQSRNINPVCRFI